MELKEIALKISEEMGLEDDEANFEFAQRVIAAVDQERGKDAVAEVVSVEPHGMAVRAIGLGRMATKSYCTLKEGDLLFISPTIPAGYALGPIEPTLDMALALSGGQTSMGWFEHVKAKYSSMIQAAQEGVTK